MCHSRWRFIRPTSIDDLATFSKSYLANFPWSDRVRLPLGRRRRSSPCAGRGWLFCPSPVKPGITGWAQINGWHGETDTKEKIEQRVLRDLDCMDQWSLGFDLHILLKIPLALLKTQNAY